jgi:diguanylate cyclase (GGDEF)-like protein/putative nucleotidyltransferase with HDIG domain
MRHLASDRRAGLALLALTAVFGLLAIDYVFQPSEALRHVLNVAVYNNLMIAAGLVCVARGVLRPRERVAWILVGAAVLAWGIGDTVWTFTVSNEANPPFPSYADIGFLSVYPPAYVAIVLMLRARVPRLHRSLWLDGVIGGLAVAAVGTAVVFQAVLRMTGGSSAAVATNLAYPLADLTLIALVVWALGVVGWRPGRAWGLIAAGLLVFSISDCLYLYETAVGSYVYGSPTDLGWVAGGLLLAWAAWQPRAEATDVIVEGRWLLVAPVTSGLLALGVLVYDHGRPVNMLALALAAGTIVAVIVRMAMTFAENMHMVASFRAEARTDALTGLANRRKLLDDLGRVLADGGGPVCFAVFDLNGFKQYNDSYGHLAGDALLTRLGKNLARYIGRRGTAYRLGGDEFCLLWYGQAGHEVVVEGASASLGEHGDGFMISSAYGSVLLPTEAGTAMEALRLADQRMYTQKHGRGVTPGEQSTGVLLTALAERDPGLCDHLNGVAELAEALAGRLGLSHGEVLRTRLAASLHDIGKMAIPDEILDKPGPLTEDEWKFVRRHTLVGERILLAAPALSHVAGIVRSSHERFDGGGYPDGLAGEAIPLAARVVLLCDAFEAMTSGRAYSSRLTEAQAVAELRREAGGQFDPGVVQAFLELLAERSEEHVHVAVA